MKRRSRIGVAAVTVGAALIATSGLAYAGALPGAAQSTAAAALSRVGVHVPGRHANPAAHPQGGGGSPSHSTTHGHGQAVSTLAHTTTETGRDKGAAISTFASDGKSHAGQPPGRTRTHTAGKGHGNANHGKASHGRNSNRGKRSASGAGVTTGFTASSGRNGHGAATSRAASKGHSSAGSHNAGPHRHHH